MKTEHMTKGKGDPTIVGYIKEKSRKMAKTKEEVETEILGRVFWDLYLQDKGNNIEEKRA